MSRREPKTLRVVLRGSARSCLKLSPGQFATAWTGSNPDVRRHRGRHRARGVDRAHSKSELASEVTLRAVIQGLRAEKEKGGFGSGGFKISRKD